VDKLSKPPKKVGKQPDTTPFMKDHRDPIPGSKLVLQPPKPTPAVVEDVPMVIDMDKDDYFSLCVENKLLMLKENLNILLDFQSQIKAFKRKLAKILKSTETLDDLNIEKLPCWFAMKWFMSWSKVVSSKASVGDIFDL